MASEQETMAVVAGVVTNALREDPAVEEVFTFGGGASGLPGIRMNRTDGQSWFLVTLAGDGQPSGTTSEPPSGRTREAEFLTLVREAIREAQPPEIARTDTILEGLMPVGLAFTGPDGYTFRTRAFCTTTARSIREVGGD